MEREATQLDVCAPAERRDIVKLEESFRMFTQMTRNLESSYDKLGRRAARIDLELRRANRELEDKVRELEQVSRNRSGILDSLPVGVVVIDAAGTISSLNPAAERILGRKAGELLGRSRDTMVGPSGDRLLVASDDAARGRGAPIERDIVALDGSRRRVSTVLSTLSEGDELQMLTDLTVVTRLREQVTRLDTLAALGEMAAGVAHEIRNPLNGIDGFASLLARSIATLGGGDNVVRYADNIRRGVREVNAIIANLLTFAAPEAALSGSVSLGALADDALLEAREGASEARIEVGAAIEPAARAAHVRGDPIKLKIVLRNLLKNAREAVRTRGKIALELRLDRIGRRAVISVSDSGPGLPEEVRERLFRPFTTTKAEGTGLGLAIAHKLVTLHQGELRHEDLNPGTRFVVSLPLTEESGS
jgi:two-component system, sensor histidine kinase FlrB